MELDIHEFLRINSQLASNTVPDTNMEQKQGELLERMIALYKGDLMEGSDYGDLVLHERERL